MAEGVATTTYYDLLGVSREATDAELRTAFHARTRELRRAKADAEQVELLEEGYAVLTDPASRAEYDARLRSLALFQEFEAEEPEWMAAYHRQLNALSDAENEVAEPQLDDIFAQLATRGRAEVQRDVQRLFARLRSERCKERLRLELLPQVRLLPKDQQKGTLAHVLDMFGTLDLDDDAVFQAGLRLIDDNLHPPPPAPVLDPDPSPSDPEHKGKRKKPKATTGDAPCWRPLCTG